jgi:hypothetical protein
MIARDAYAWCGRSLHQYGILLFLASVINGVLAMAFVKDSAGRMTPVNNARAWMIVLAIGHPAGRVAEHLQRAGPFDESQRLNQ